VANGKLVDAAERPRTHHGPEAAFEPLRISVAAFSSRKHADRTGDSGGALRILDRLVNLSPRIRDFRGVPTKGFDGRGNYTLGIKEQIIFPEIEYDKIAQVFGMDITIVTSARTDEQALALLTHMKMPFRKN
jgi:large subunit ribosomal protein L5